MGHCFPAQRKKMGAAFRYSRAHGILASQPLLFPPGNAMYLVLGGYGQLTYKNKVTRYNFATRQWRVSISKETITRRVTLLPGVYPATPLTSWVVSEASTGEQMLNPKYLYDLILYDGKSADLPRRCVAWRRPKNLSSFAHSMIIDDHRSKLLRAYLSERPLRFPAAADQRFIGKNRLRICVWVMPYLISFPAKKSYADVFSRGTVKHSSP